MVNVVDKPLGSVEREKVSNGGKHVGTAKYAVIVNVESGCAKHGKIPKIRTQEKSNGKNESAALLVVFQIENLLFAGVRYGVK